MTINDDIRKRVIEAYYEQRIERKDIAMAFGIKLSTVYSIVKVFEMEGRYSKKLKGGPRKKLIDDQHIRFIRDCIEEDCGTTLKTIKQKLLRVFNLQVSEVTIGRYISGFNFSFKRVSLEPIRRNDSENIECRAQYAQEYLNLLGVVDEANVIFIDEVGFNISMRTLYGRSKIGSRAIHKVGAIRSHNISVCCAITKNGVFKFSYQNTAYNTESFKNFIVELSEKLEENNLTNVAFIMDNVRFHKVEAIKQFISNKNHRLLYLPPYSPFLNPIENAFSKWKQFIRQSKPQNISELLLLIERVTEIITPNDCSSFYRNMMTFIAKSLAREIITDG